VRADNVFGGIIHGAVRRDKNKHTLRVGLPGKVTRYDNEVAIASAGFE
jgi:hypothetical protein